MNPPPLLLLLAPQEKRQSGFEDRENAWQKLYQLGGTSFFYPEEKVAVAKKDWNKCLKKVREAQEAQEAQLEIEGKNQLAGSWETSQVSPPPTGRVGVQEDPSHFLARSPQIIPSCPRKSGIRFCPQKAVSKKKVPQRAWGCLPVPSE